MQPSPRVARPRPAALQRPAKRPASGLCYAPIAGDCFVSADEGLAKRAMDVLVGWRVLGLRQRERILPVGAFVTVIGELAHSESLGLAFEGCVPSGDGRVLVLQVGGYAAF